MVHQTQQAHLYLTCKRRYGFNGAPLWDQETRFYDWVLIHWEQGFRDGPYSLVSWESGRMPFAFVCLSFSFFLFVVLILGAVISGVIIDTFGAERDADYERNQDIHDVCH